MKIGSAFTANIIPSYEYVYIRYERRNIWEKFFNSIHILSRLNQLIVLWSSKRKNIFSFAQIYIGLGEFLPYMEKKSRAKFLLFNNIEFVHCFGIIKKSFDNLDDLILIFGFTPYVGTIKFCVNLNECKIKF